MTGLILFAGMFVNSCGSVNGGVNGGETPFELRFTVSDFKINSSYHWIVIAEDGMGGVSESVVRRFMTQ